MKSFSQQSTGVLEYHGKSTENHLE